jgi:DnaK suppressor protein
MVQYNPEQVGRLLEARRGQLIERRDRINHDLSRANEPLPLDAIDRAVQLENDEALQEIGSVAENEIAAIDTALQRLALDLYGTCSVCGSEISAARLQAVASAVTCADCAVR